MDWQPIETAPRDGTEVLLSGFNYNDPGQGRWIAVGMYLKPHGCWYSDGDDPNATLCAPTHWMPLPPPPK